MLANILKFLQSKILKRFHVGKYFKMFWKAERAGEKRGLGLCKGSELRLQLQLQNFSWGQL